MKKLISTLLYVVIIFAFYGGLKILMLGNVPEAGIFYPFTGNSHVEGFYLVADRGPLWPLEEANLEMPLPLSHLAPSKSRFPDRPRWLNLPAQVQTLGSVEKIPTNFIKSGAGIRRHQPHNTQSNKEKQLANFFGYGGMTNQEDQSTKNHNTGIRRGSKLHKIIHLKGEQVL